MDLDRFESEICIVFFKGFRDDDEMHYEKFVRDLTKYSKKFK